MSRRDPIAYGLLLLGFGAGYCRYWLPHLAPGYHDWVWWRHVALRLAVVVISALAAWAVITWRLSWASSHADPGAYWAMWGMGLVAGVVVDEIHGYVDSMFP
jgi:hypothetical protein